MGRGYPWRLGWKASGVRQQALTWETGPQKCRQSLPPALDILYSYSTCLLLLIQVNSASFIFASASFDSSYARITQLLLASTSLLFSLKSNFRKQVEEFSHWKIFIDLFCLPYLLMKPLSPWYFFLFFFFFSPSDVFVKALLLPFNPYALAYPRLWVSFSYLFLSIHSDSRWGVLCLFLEVPVSSKIFQWS